MKQNRSENQDVPTRSSNMEQAEGSRETARSSELMRNRGSSSSSRSSGGDLGTSSDRAMFSDDLPIEQQSDSQSGSSSRSERGVGSEGERNRARSGGISNRELDREQNEQDMLPGRGRSQSDEQSDESER